MIDRRILTAIISGESTVGINYYVSNSGSSENDGLSPENAVDPDSIGSLDTSNPCTINFNRGETFHVSLVINNQDIKFSAYGTGNDPIFDGSIDISVYPWTDEGGGIWSTPMENFPYSIIMHGECAKLSESPWIQIVSTPNAANFEVDPGDIPYASIVGAKLIHKFYNWSVEKTFDVGAYTPGTGYINVGSGVPTSATNRGLQLFGLQEFFSGNNEWAWESGVLYVKAASTPAGMDIRQVVFNVGLTIQDGSHNCTVENIEFKHYHLAGIYRLDANSCVFRNLTIHDMRGSGIRCIKYPLTCYAYNNEIYNCSDGITDFGTLTPHYYLNTLYDHGTQANYSWNIDDGYMPLDNPITAIGNGIFYLNMNQYNLPAHDGLFHDNTIYNCAYLGIRFNGVDFKIYNNIIHDTMLRYSDGGCIFSHGNTFSGDPRVDVEGALVYNNILYDTLGSKEGLFESGDPVASGIQIDGVQDTYFAYDNVIYNCQDGIRSNPNTEQSSLTNNLIVGCKYGIIFRNTVSTTHQNFGNISTGNIIAVRALSSYCYGTEYSSTYNPFNTGGESDNNYYINPYSDKVFHRDLASERTFTDLQTQYSEDANSVAVVNYLTYTDEATALTEVLLYTNETDSAINQLIPSGYEDIDGNDISGTTIEIPPRSTGRPGLLILKSA